MAEISSETRMMYKRCLTELVKLAFVDIDKGSLPLPIADTNSTCYLLEAFFGYKKNISYR